MGEEVVEGRKRKQAEKAMGVTQKKVLIAVNILRGANIACSMTC